MANDVIDSTNVGSLLQGIFTKIKNAFWQKSEVNELPIDATPTANSNNLVKSGGVYSALSGKQDTIVFNTTYNASSNKAATMSDVPTISTDIASDATSDTKTASPKAVKTFVENKGYGTYSKPSGGIPASDLASGVIPTVPTISTDVATDKSSTTKTASPSAVYAEVHPAIATTQPQGGFLPKVVYDLGTLTGSQSMLSPPLRMQR